MSCHWLRKGLQESKWSQVSPTHKSAEHNLTISRYHKTHGHQTQRLHENGDGTFSIVNPETSAPYPGTLGMEKEKPYKCEVCGKRYKNLNGLKYVSYPRKPLRPRLTIYSINNTRLPATRNSSSIPTWPLSGWVVLV